MDVIPISDARSGLSRLLVDFRLNPHAPTVVIGSHRRPEAALVPIARYREISDAASDRPVTMERLRALKQVIERLAEAAHLADVKVYGSVARGDQTADSDLDLLVTPTAAATLFDIAQFEMDMEVLLAVPVSAMSTGALHDDRDHRILRDAVAL